MNIDPANPEMENRDRFVLSKGHTAPGLYAALAYRGFFPVEDLTTLRKLGSYLQGHPNLHIPGVDMASGSLGQGISAAVGDCPCANYPVPVKKIGMQDVFGESGSAAALVHKYGLDAEGVFASVKSFL